MQCLELEREELERLNKTPRSPLDAAGDVIKQVLTSAFLDMEAPMKLVRRSARGKTYCFKRLSRAITAEGLRLLHQRLPLLHHEEAKMKSSLLGHYSLQKCCKIH